MSRHSNYAIYNKRPIIIGCTKNQQQENILPKQIIVHPCLDVLAAKNVHDITKIICKKNHAKQDLRKHLICLTDFDHDCIFGEI